MPEPYDDGEQEIIGDEVNQEDAEVEESDNSASKGEHSSESEQNNPEQVNEKAASAEEA